MSIEDIQNLFFCNISSHSFSERTGPGPLGPVRKVLVVRSGPEGPQFARSVGTLSCCLWQIFIDKSRYIKNTGFCLVKLIYLLETSLKRIQSKPAISSMKSLDKSKKYSTQYESEWCKSTQKCKNRRKYNTNTMSDIRSWSKSFWHNKTLSSLVIIKSFIGALCENVSTKTICGMV